MRLLARFLGFVFATGAIVFLIAAVAGSGLIYYYSKDLPDTAALQNYEPPVTTRLHANDGSILAEYSRERRLFLPSSAIPPLVKQAFISAEDKNFYTHNGVDPEGVAARCERPGRRRSPCAGRLDHHPAGRQELPRRQ